MKVSEFWPEKWLKPEHLPKAVVVTISGVTAEDFVDQRTKKTERKPVVAFERATKRLILNKTQALAIANALASEEMDEWRGRQIMLARGKAHNGKDTVVCSAPPQQDAPAAQPAQAQQEEAQEDAAGDTCAGCGGPLGEGDSPLCNECVQGDDDDVPDYGAGDDEQDDGAVSEYSASIGDAPW